MTTSIKNSKSRGSVVDLVTISQVYEWATGVGTIDAKLTSNGLQVRCPVRDHPDNNPSASLCPADGTWWCFSCSRGGGKLSLIIAAGLANTNAQAALWLEEKLGLSRPERQEKASVAALARERKLSEKTLREQFGLRDVARGVEIPYRNSSGNLARTRIRKYLDRSHPTLWGPGNGSYAYVPARSLELMQALGELDIVEGETDVWALLEHGIPAVGIPGASMIKALTVACFRGVSRVRVLKEPGEAGAAFVIGVTKRLRHLGFDGPILVVDLRAVCDAKDPSELHVRDPEAFASEWARAVAAAKPAEEPKTARPWPDVALDVAPHYEIVGQVEAADEASWGARLELPCATPAAAGMPFEMVPEPLRAWVQDICERMRLPAEMVAIAAMIAIATVVGCSIGVKPKRRDDWIVVPNLWGAIVAPPGYLKTPALQEALRPLKTLARAAALKHEEACKERDPLRKDVEDVIAALEVNLKKGLRSGKPVDEIREQIACKRAEGEALKNVEKRYFTNDTTIEKLGELLRDNPRGLLVFRDEIAGWMRSLDTQDRPNDRGFYLECWNGDGSYNFERIGRGSVRIPNACISILGSIQPGPLSEYVEAANGNGRGADGLLQRFQLLIWPDEFPNWENVDRYPDAAARERVVEILKTLDSLDVAAFGVEVVDDREIPSLRFAEDAQLVFDCWRDDLEKRLRSDELRDRPAYQAHIAKYRSLMPSLAMLFHLIDVGIGSTTDARVSIRSAKLAVDWCGLLESHAAKLYASECAVGRGLAARIEKGDVHDGMTVREIGRKGWSGLKGAEQVRKAVIELQAYGWARIESRTSDKGVGRSSDVLRIHPELRERRQ